ncbi:hypothetical protein SAMN06265379_102242 [Saccharicrinis carchari]|uniref:Calx-beta domain-containing protein n=1 Tax=Saccharicrinis carchari TaxID=1168039 RepID=A0A521BZ97_SACCC|nr:hypothetical protein [Saccharicrinis carchari]SMO52405.1 hypothetical protein SAMN06265379_102242 [Saccharicrinis carchari]
MTKIFQYTLFLLFLVLVSCSKDEGPEFIYAYFPEKSVSMVENSGQTVEIPVKIFAMEDLENDFVLNYTISGDGAARVQDQSGGSITVEKGYKAYIQYIRLAPIDNTDSDGDASLTLNLQGTNAKTVIGLGNDNMNSTMAINVLDDDIACLASLWEGALKCNDDIYPSYSPNTCSGEIIDGNCMQVRVSFDFWGDSNLHTILELKLGDIDPVTNQGPVTLMSEYNAVSSGYDMTFYAGDAGIYDANTFELKLAVQFTGYDIGGDGKYRFTVKK